MRRLLTVLLVLGALTCCAVSPAAAQSTHKYIGVMTRPNGTEWNVYGRYPMIRGTVDGIEGYRFRSVIFVLKTDDNNNKGKAIKR